MDDSSELGVLGMAEVLRDVVPVLQAAGEHDLAQRVDAYLAFFDDIASDVQAEETIETAPGAQWPAQAPLEQLHPVHYQILHDELRNISFGLSSIQSGMRAANDATDKQRFQWLPPKALRPVLWFIIPTAFALFFGAAPLDAIWYGIVPAVSIALMVFSLSVMYGIFLTRMLRTIEHVSDRVAELGSPTEQKDG